MHAKICPHTDEESFRHPCSRLQMKAWLKSQLGLQQSGMKGCRTKKENFLSVFVCVSVFVCLCLSVSTCVSLCLFVCAVCLCICFCLCLRPCVVLCSSVCVYLGLSLSVHLVSLPRSHDLLKLKGTTFEHRQK